ncbi:uncharacterized protein LOC111400656 [Olea europaea var. sylvestris]|uniref:uncharacterized protein LOC111400656 n=1 Tax=Olea europaea var. sylvestris TaxID=158386 RepID=UPI000C1CCFBB|nr:uncharacterized protein LOC111400656 [Olea europaea var. sylvestris]
MLLTGSNTMLLNSFVVALHQEFDIKDLGFLHYFLVTCTTNGLLLSQSTYALDIIKRAQMEGRKPMNTQISPKYKHLDDVTPFHDPTHYHSLVGALQYLTFTRPDLSFSVNFVLQFMHSPMQGHYQLVNRIIRYVHGTITFGLHMCKQSTLNLYGFSDFDWADIVVRNLMGHTQKRIDRFKDTRRSTSGFCKFLGSNIISWSAKKQASISRSSSEAEYKSMANATVELLWLSYLLHDLGILQNRPPLLLSDNQSALHMVANPVFHARGKHIEIDYHFVRENVQQGQLRTRHLPSKLQMADIFTKPLDKPTYEFIRHKLSLIPQHNLRKGVKNTEIVESPPCKESPAKNKIVQSPPCKERSAENEIINKTTQIKEITRQNANQLICVK